MTTRLVLTALLVVGCSCREPEAPTATGAPTPPPSVAPAPSVVTAPPPATHVPPTPEAIARMRTELAEGRRLAHSGDAAGALPHFQAALEAAPNPRARCEAGYVAHQAGQAETAQTLVTQALRELPDAEHVSDDLRVPLAMCFYNAGLVLESENDRTGAADAFQRSLVLRENATVREALARVGGGATHEAPSEHGTLAAMIDAQREAWCSNVGIECPDTCAESTTAPDLSDGGCRTMTLGPGAIPGTPGFEAVLFEASAFDGGVLGLVLGAGDTRTWLELTESTRPGAELGSSDSYTLGAMSWQDVIPGGPSELVIELGLSGVTNYASDEPEAYCEDFEGSEWNLTIVCAAIDASIPCTAVTRSQHSEATHGCYPSGWQGDEAPDATRAVTEWALDLRFENGQAVLTSRTAFSATGDYADDDRAAYEARVGSHDVAALLREHPCEAPCGP